MFNTKKKLQRELYEVKVINERLLTTNEMLSQRISEYKAANAELHSKLEDAERRYAEERRKNESTVHDVHTVYAERDELLKANGELKRKADKLQKDNDELTEAMAERLARDECPEDCKGRADKSPGRSYCRACIRNPHAVDKYEAGGNG